MSQGPDHVVAVIQARYGSHRLPGKVLADIGGTPLLAHVIERVRAASTIDAIVVATTEGPEDDAVAAFAERSGVGVHRGSTADVLDRMYRAAVAAGATIVVRITADDPFKDPAVIDRVVEELRSSRELDYSSNTLEPSFPEGVDVECLRISALEAAWRRATLPSDREHVTSFIWRQPSEFRLRNIAHSVDLSTLRWTIDHPADLELARRVQSHLPADDLSMSAVLAVFEAHPELHQLNVTFERNEGYHRSVAAQTGEPERPSTHG